MQAQMRRQRSLTTWLMLISKKQNSWCLHNKEGAFDNALFFSFASLLKGFLSLIVRCKNGLAKSRIFAESMSEIYSNLKSFHTCRPRVSDKRVASRWLFRNQL